MNKTKMNVKIWNDRIGSIMRRDILRGKFLDQINERDFHNLYIRYGIKVVKVD
ncbi:MAG: hypothetical protein J6U54_11235 [Clostridiales bacterium]|nr:hypothetical protein [Clostridiales bacterium]